MKNNKKSYGTFGYTKIYSNTINALSNNYQNENELRKELQGKPISIETIEDAMKKVEFSKYGGECKVHSIFPDAGKCYVGEYRISGSRTQLYASVVIEWNVENQKYENLMKELKEIKDGIKKLIKEK